MIKYIHNKLTTAIIFMVAAMLFIRCTTPPNSAYAFTGFNPITGWEGDKPIEFKLLLADTIGVGELYLTAKITNNNKIGDINYIPINVTISSPNGEKSSNDIELPINITQNKKSYRQYRGAIEIEWPFIKNIKNKNSGTWSFTIKQNSSSPIYKNITGFGISYKPAK